MMIWDGFNKRKFPRLNLQCEIEIFSENKTFSTIRTVTENVGIGGVCVIMDQMLERFSECGIRLELEQPVPSVRCSGRIIWAVTTRDLHSKKARYDTGIEFVGLDPENQQALKRFLEERVKTMPKEGVS